MAGQRPLEPLIVVRIHVSQHLSQYSQNKVKVNRSLIEAQQNRTQSLSLQRIVTVSSCFLCISMYYGSEV